MPFDNVTEITPWAKDDPPWCECGNVTAPDFGSLWAEPGALGGTILWCDRERRHFAETIYAPRTVGAVHRWQGRLWKVRRLEPAGPEAA